MEFRKSEIDYKKYHCFVNVQSIDEVASNGVERWRATPLWETIQQHQITTHSAKIEAANKIPSRCIPLDCLFSPHTFIRGIKFLGLPIKPGKNGISKGLNDVNATTSGR